MNEKYKKYDHAADAIGANETEREIIDLRIEKHLTEQELVNLYRDVRELSEFFMFDVETAPQNMKDNVIKEARKDIEKLYQKLLEMTHEIRRSS